MYDILSITRLIGSNHASLYYIILYHHITKEVPASPCKTRDVGYKVNYVKSMLFYFRFYI